MADPNLHRIEGPSGQKNSPEKGSEPFTFSGRGGKVECPPFSATRIVPRRVGHDVPRNLRATTCHTSRQIVPRSISTPSRPKFARINRNSPTALRLAVWPSAPPLPCLVALPFSFFQPDQHEVRIVGVSGSAATSMRTWLLRNSPNKHRRCSCERSCRVRGVLQGHGRATEGK